MNGADPLCLNYPTKVELDSDTLFHVAAARASGWIDVASHAAASLVLGPIGVIYSNTESGMQASVAVFGKARVVTGAAVAAHKALTTNGSGRAIEAASGDVIFGRALTASAADGEIISCLLFPAVRLSGAI